MKKNYLKPETDSVELESECLLDGSNYLPNGEDEDAGAKKRIIEFEDEFGWEDVGMIR
ncbi:MAG: hypothetical protein KBT29_01665 [Prevotellaceae bacterium]|nr:hypothetical protein [Candidatus Minthosoma caballi]